MLELIFVRDVIGRPFIAPPDLPAARVKTLQDAFAATIKDPAFVADAEKQYLTITLMPGPAFANVVADAYKAPPEIVKRAAAAMGR